MSLRDQLLAKGLVSKKQARKVDQELRKERRKEQGDRRRQRDVEAEARAAREAALREKQERRAEANRQIARLERERERRSEAFRIIVQNRLRCRGPIVFHFRDLDGRTLRRMAVSQGAGDALRHGRAAIVGFDHGGRVDYAVIPARAAERLEEVAPECVLLRFERSGELGPDEQFWEPEWEIDLRPHRATEEEVARLRRRAV